jgi:hypothetical protein
MKVSVYSERILCMYRRGPCECVLGEWRGLWL